MMRKILIATETFGEKTCRFQIKRHYCWLNFMISNSFLSFPKTTVIFFFSLFLNQWVLSPLFCPFIPFFVFSNLSLVLSLFYINKAPTSSLTLQHSITPTRVLGAPLLFVSSIPQVLRQSNLGCSDRRPLWNPRKGKLSGLRGEVLLLPVLSSDRRQRKGSECGRASNHHAQRREWQPSSVRTTSLLRRYRRGRCSIWSSS